MSDGFVRYLSWHVDISPPAHVLQRFQSNCCIAVTFAEDLIGTAYTAA